MPTAAKSFKPEGMNPVTPHLICRGAAEAIDFYVRAFGAVENGRMPGPDGKLMNAMITLQGGTIMLVDENFLHGMKSPQSYGGSAVSVHVFVPDIDAFAARAEAEGAEIMMKPEDQFWGDRFCMMRDPFGHVWSFATHQYDLTPEEMAAGAEQHRAEIRK
ncbi:putative glyoxalase superfamily protein PhnB [Hoeflea marina]|uniref:Putative glyoxalase superfamily protein PhnB n=1 Tax=Hoeflea marina TaxID=274592 RepID=A0A317PPI1_9HYPH|nr:VOC family protein [Hoeflea marina]PWW03362.1 putative glyoxalase superfamily protein PhnB [Hoeflea marina]